jgi:hypothetical protein
VRTNLSKQNISDIESSSTRTICLIDTDTPDFNDIVLQKYIELREKNVQMILLSTQYLKVPKLYNALGSHRLLIHRKERLKAIQRVFFKQVIKLICSDDIEFDQYFYIMNHDNFGVRYIIMKTDELRYN